MLLGGPSLPELSGCWGWELGPEPAAGALYPGGAGGPAPYCAAPPLPLGRGGGAYAAPGPACGGVRPAGGRWMGAWLLGRAGCAELPRRAPGSGRRVPGPTSGGRAAESCEEQAGSTSPWLS